MPGQRGLSPRLTVDIIIERENSPGIVLIERKYPPPGWAIPGGFVEYGETLEAAAEREALEETSLRVRLVEQLYTFSDPARDPRHHTVTTVFIARARGKPAAADDAAGIGIFTERSLPAPLAFDHKNILREYFRYKKTGKKPGILHARDRRRKAD